MTTQSTAVETGSPMIVVDRVSKSVAGKKATVILDEVSFAVPKRSLFCISGRSGSGKSTLLNMITGIDRPTHGGITFGGRALRDMTESQLARWRGANVGIVFQFFQLIPTLTAEENILLALQLGRVVPRREWRNKALSALDTVGLAGLAGSRPSELSGAEQQRVAIARALVNNPSVLLADEPTGNLSSQAELEIFTLLERVHLGGSTVVYVTHDRDLAARATEHVELLDGRIVSRSYGAAPGIYART
jgi:ABC-type lipoprotein export system ATPase subunit